MADPSIYLLPVEFVSVGVLLAECQPVDVAYLPLAGNLERLG